MKLLQTSGLIVVCASLFACASPITSMSPKEAIQFGNNQFYEMPSYRMDMSSKVVNIGLLGGADEGSEKSDEAFNKYLNFFSKKFIFSGVGVFDTANDQYQIIPEYGYEAKNINAHIRFPMVLDRKAKTLYADLSALDGVVTNLDNAGKYSRFDLSKLPIPEGADKKMVDVMRKYTKRLFDTIPAGDISEQPLSAEDRKVSAVRKLQLTLKPTDQIALYPEMLHDMAAIIFPNPDKAPEDFKQDTDKFSQEISQWFAPESRDLYTFVFNRAGQIVSMKADSNYIIQPKAGKDNFDELNSPSPTGDTAKGFQLHFVTDMSVSDIGKAKLIDPPTAENSVDGMENLKQSPFGKSFFSKYNDNADDQTWKDNDVVVDAAVAAKPIKKPSKSNKKKRR